MILERLACTGFRNLEPTEVELSPGTTLLVGDIGQGKTSFLEAIGVLATTKSFRKARAPELVAHGESTFHVRGTVESGGARTDLAVAHEGGRRTTWLGRAQVELAEYYVGQLVVVAITQAHGYSSCGIFTATFQCCQRRIDEKSNQIRYESCG
jgi:DNA replication and repair protein RecF